MARKKLIYIISPRSAYSWNPGRKISSIIALWSKKYDLTCFFGGDLIRPTADGTVQYGNPNIHEKLYYRYNILQPFVHTYSEIKDIAHNINSYLFLSRCYGDAGFSIVWERSSRLHFAGLIYAKKHKIPFVLEWKDNLISYKFSFLKFLALYVEDYKCRKADKIIVESYVLKQMLAEKGYDSNKIHVAHNASDLDVFKRNENKGKKYRQQVNISPSSIVVGYLGSYAFYHNALLLVKAAKIINDKHLSVPVKFLMVGNGLDYQLCKNYALEHNISEDYLKFQPPVEKEHVPNILSAVDISVLPGSTEIIAPIKILEYMASGTATLVPNYKCNTEVVSGENGILFKPYSAVDLADKIIELVLNKPLSLSIAKNGVITAKKYSWESTWGVVLDSVIGDLTKSC